MEIRRVQYFIALSETLNFTRAAETCNVAQPTLTNGIKKLEEELGGPLVNRERANTHLTELGQTVLPLLKQVYENSIAASEAASQLSEKKRVSLRFGCSNVVPNSALLSHLQAARASQDGLEVHLEGAEDSDLVQLLMDGGLHFVLVDEGQVPEERLRFYPIYQEPFVVVMPETDPLAKEDFVTFSQLAERPWIEHLNCPAHSQLLEAMQAQHADFTPRQSAKRSFEIQTMCLAQLGLSLIGDHETILAGLTTRPLPEFDIFRQIGLAEARGRPQTPTVQTFSRLLRAQFF